MRSFSKILDKPDSRLMGRYERASEGHFPGFKIIEMPACFHFFGKWPIRRMELKISDLRRSSSSISSFSSFSVIGRIGWCSVLVSWSCCCSNCFHPSRMSVLSLSDVCRIVWNRSSRCLAKTSAFSRVVLDQETLLAPLLGTGRCVLSGFRSAFLREFCAALYCRFASGVRVVINTRLHCCL